MAKATPFSAKEPQAAKIAKQLGFELIEMELVKENTGRFLRFYIDKEGGVSLNDCEVYHRAVQPLVEELDYDYMEVASPGADRPLKKPEDFDRAQGITVEVKLYRAIDGLKRYVGTLVGLIDGRVVIEAGEEKSFELKDIAQVAPLIEIDEDELSDIFDIEEE